MTRWVGSLGFHYVFHLLCQCCPVYHHAEISQLKAHVLRAVDIQYKQWRLINIYWCNVNTKPPQSSHTHIYTCTTKLINIVHHHSNHGEVHNNQRHDGRVTADTCHHHTEAHSAFLNWKIFLIAQEWKPNCVTLILLSCYCFSSFDKFPKLTTQIVDWCSRTVLLRRSRIISAKIKTICIRDAV